MKQVFDVTNRHIAEMWDRIAQERLDYIVNGKDKSYTNILMPSIFGSIEDEFHKKAADEIRILDAGCGVGYFSHILHQVYPSAKIDGVDISGISIHIANKNFASESVRFSVGAVEKRDNNREYDLIVANMFLMDCVYIRGVVSALEISLVDNGVLISTVPHPFFWPLYWGYASENWFDYKKEIAIESDFVTSSTGRSRFQTIHFHRPLEMYVNILRSSNLIVEKIEEIANDREVGYVKARMPRYLKIVARKSNY